VLAHSIVPHHHHNEISVLTDTDHHDDEDEGLVHDFSNYPHSGSTGDAYQPSIKIVCDHLDIVYVAAVFEFIMQPIENPPPVAYVDTSIIPSSDYTLSAKGLRAPPFC
jgi:hypothetical protein